MKYKHWRLEQDQDGIFWLYFDKADSVVNIIDSEVLEELIQVLSQAAQVKNKGLVVASAKPSGFIAGADVEQFTRLRTEEETVALIALGQRAFLALEAFATPTVAMINGFCLGGGLELALACRYRVAEDGPKTKLGLPEVKLGIQPGWGGTVRLPRLVGAITGLELILTGRTVSGKAAMHMGFVDAAVPARHLIAAARFQILKKPTAKHPTWWARLTHHAWIRPLIAKKMLAETAKKVRREHYPSPFAVIENWREVGVSDAAYDLEVKSITRLMLSGVAKNLVRVFFLQERLKGLGKHIEFKPTHVHVIGAGVMGGDIAAWCALSGMTVTLQDREAKFIAPAIKRAFSLYEKRLKTPRAIQEAMDRLIPDVDGEGIAKADVCIEAIFENLEAKQSLFKLLETKAKPTAILATNTSSIPLEEIGRALTKPERLVGIHFFNPVSQMPLVEVVSGEATDREITGQALAFVRRIDKLPLPVKSSPGFLVNRVLMPYLLEAVVMLEEGIPAPLIDEAAESFGMPMGPIELADTVGLDVCLAVGENLATHFGGVVPNRLKELVKAKQLGRKTGQGFYPFRDGKPIKDADYAKNITGQEVADRLIGRMLKEAQICLQEGVVQDPDLLDAGMIFGTGFAPFRGGPMQYMQHEGERFRMI